MTLTNIDWDAAAGSLDRQGFARLPGLLTPPECERAVEWYAQADLFRSRIEMATFRFGRGEYQYFRYPLPPLVESLRRALYPRLARVANQWAPAIGTPAFPDALDDLLALCREHGQAKPTPLMLRYEPGDFNCLHQDIYGDLAFPLQVVIALSEPGRDYTGGEFLLVEQHPRAQSVGRALTLGQGEGLAITTRYRPVEGKRGTYRVNVRHGVSPLTGGRRWTLGIIFHDAK